jgi:transposase
MIQIAPGTRVYLACRPVDMRRGFDGLSADVVNKLHADPYSGHMFLFRGKSGGYLKVLYWDGAGMCLFSKRLEHRQVRMAVDCGWCLAIDPDADGATD